jgi:hypothetical protein
MTFIAYELRQEKRSYRLHAPLGFKPVILWRLLINGVLQTQSFNTKRDALRGVKVLQAMWPGDLKVTPLSTPVTQQSTQEEPMAQGEPI